VIEEFVKVGLGKLNELGFDSFEAYFAAFPSDSLSEIAQRLGALVGAFPLAAAYSLELARKGRRREAAIEVVVRRVRDKFPAGVPTEASSYQLNACILAPISCFRMAGLPNDELFEVAERFRTSRPPDGWLPDSLDDSYLNDVFQAWPPND